MQHLIVFHRFRQYNLFHNRSGDVRAEDLTTEVVSVHTQKLIIIPKVMASCCTATSDPRISGGALQLSAFAFDIVIPEAYSLARHCTAVQSYSSYQHPDQSRIDRRVRSPCLPCTLEQ